MCPALLNHTKNWFEDDIEKLETEFPDKIELSKFQFKSDWVIVIGLGIIGILALIIRRKINRKKKRTMLHWIKNVFKKETPKKSNFEITFSDLKGFANRNINGAKRTYELLKELNKSSSENDSDELIKELNKIKYASNTNSVFYFYFPIVSHILYFKPEYEKEILGLIIGPNFANGDTEIEDMINVIQGAMIFKQKENSKYLTQEGEFWTKNLLPNMKNEIKREIEICWKELNE